MIDVMRQLVQNLMAAEPAVLWIIAYFICAGFASSVGFYFLNSWHHSTLPQTRNDEKIAAVFHFLFGGVLLPLLPAVFLGGLIVPQLVKRLNRK